MENNRSIAKYKFITTCFAGGKNNRIINNKTDINEAFFRM